MATQKLISLFEEVRTGKNGIKLINKRQASKDAEWFYKKYKTNYPEMNDAEIEKAAKDLIYRFVFIGEDISSKIEQKIKENSPKNNNLKPSLETAIGAYLKTKLKNYFKEIEKPINQKNASKNISKDLLEGLIKIELLPRWTKTEIQRVINKYHNIYKDLSLKTDNEFAAYERLFAAYERIAITEKYPVADRNPNFFLKIVGQFFELKEEVDKNWKEYLKDLNRRLNKYKSMDEVILAEEKEMSRKRTGKKPKPKKGFYDVGKVSIYDDSVTNKFVDKLFDEMQDPDIEKMVSKIERYSNEVRKKVPKQEARAFDILIEVVTDPNIDAKTEKKISDLCKNRLMAEGITAVNFSAIKSRLLKILREDKSATDMLQFITLPSAELLLFSKIINSLDLDKKEMNSTEANGRVLGKYRKFSYEDYLDEKYYAENNAYKWIVEKISDLTNISIKDIVKVIEEFFKIFSGSANETSHYDVLPETLYKFVSDILTTLLKKGLINIEMCNEITEETNKILKK